MRRVVGAIAVKASDPFYRLGGFVPLKSSRPREVITFPDGGVTPFNEGNADYVGGRRARARGCPLDRRHQLSIYVSRVQKPNLKPAPAPW